jgi:uncharacterized repeat protein (TIGR01451 family)
MASLCVLVWQSARTQSPLRRITNTSEEGTSINPSMSGDGRIVAFESTEDIAGAGGFESFRAIRANVGVDPATFLQIGATRAPAPAVSQDGSRIAFASKENPLGTNADANSEIFLHDGAKLIQITNTLPGDIANRVAHGNFLPSISDDGRYIAFSSNRNLASQNADGNLEIFVFDTVALSFTQLTNSSGIVGFTDAKISGNGAFVSYIRDAGSAPGAKRDLLLQNRDASSPVRVLATGVESLAMTYGRGISDDGTRVVWAAETATNTTQVFLFDGRNNATRQITTLGSRAADVPLHPTISGDGSRIAFATRRSFLGNSDGSVDLYSFDIPSASFGRITSGPSTATAEVVSSLNDDGSVIAFNFPRVLSGVSNSDFANTSEIYVTGTPTRPASGTLTVLNGASFGNEPATTEAVAPDSIAVARGSVLANTTERSQQLANGAFPLTVGGTTVTVNSRRAQIVFVSPTQVNFLVPPETEVGAAEVIVTNADGFPSRGPAITLRSAPGIFTFSGDGLGDGVVLDANTLLPAPFDPTSGNLRLIIFATGVRNGSQVSITAGGRALTLESIVPSPTMPGLDEIHVLVPADLRGAGKVDLVVRSDSRDSNAAVVSFIGDAKRDIVINEFLSDPPDSAAGDANHDGVRSTGDDEFVELANTTARDIDISGSQILTRGTGASDTIRHTFAAGTILPGCTAVVVFGGGNPSAVNPAFGGSQVLKASTGSLTLINAAGVITLRDQAATIVNFVSYGGSTGLDGDANQSVTRSPDTTGAFALHQSASGSGGSLFSPGTRVNGTAFSPCPPIARVEVSPASAIVEAGAQQQFTARAFDTGGNEVTGVIFSWQSSNPSVATIDQNGWATALAAGLTQIRASGRGIQSAPVALTVNLPIPILSSVTISPAAATSRVADTQQFTAQAKDQFGQEIGGVTITFNSNNTAIATVDAVSATSATGSATATVTGRASGVAQITATASNGSTNVSSTPAMLTVEPGAGQLLISEFRTRGPSGASDEFIEIYNPTLSTLTIGGLRIRVSNSAGTVSDRVTVPAGTTLLSGRHYLFTNSTANTGYSGPVAGNQTYATGIADDGGIAITGSNGTSIIDAVGMSSGSAYKEGTPLTPLTNNVDQSYERKPGGAAGNGKDTNNNSADFLLNATFSNPQNLDSAGFDLNTADVSITKIDSPDPVLTGTDVIYTITVTNNGPGTAQSVVVTDNLPSSVIFVLCSTTGGGICGGAGNNRTISFSSLASGSSATITMIANANGTGGTIIVNTASVTSATLDPVSGNNSATADTDVQTPLPSLTINDVSLNEGNAGATTFTFTVHSSLPAPAGGITFDIATQDGSATTANNDYLARALAAQTIPAGQQTYTFEVTINGDLLVEPNETFFVNLTNVLGATVADGQGLGTIQNDDTANLVISQVYGGGGNSGALFANDFVEIFNRGTTTVNFATTPYSVQYAGATANFGSNKIDLTSETIAPGKYYLVQLSSGGANGAALPAADAVGGINLAATAGKVALVVGTTALNAASCPTGATVSDLVGYGTTADCFEGLGRAPAPSATVADFRKADGCTDTNDNIADFLVSAPTPRNTSAPANDCTAGPPVPKLTINDVSANEGNSGTTTFTFTVTLSSPAPAGGVSFDIATADGSATDGNPAGEDTDYVARSFTSQTIVAGNLAYTFEVTVNGDLKVESNETFFVNLSNVSGATVADGQGLGTIQNDDVEPVPALSINDVSLKEGNAGPTTFTFTVHSSSPAPAGGITFDIATQDGSATTAKNDYLARALAAQTIPAGEQNYTFEVTVNGDLLVEPNETFFVNLTNVLGATVADGQGLGTIQNDDVEPVPALIINDVSLNEGNTGTTTFTFTVHSSAPAPAGGIPFEIATQDGSATTANNDYLARALAAQTIPAGQQTYTFEVIVNGDLLVEANETFFVNLTNVLGATVADGQGLGTIQNDDTANLVISQVYGGGGNSGALFANDFVEIFNRGTTTVNFATTPYSVQYAGATANFGSNKIDLTSETIAPGKYYLVQLSSGGANGAALPAADAVGGINLAATAGKVALVVGTTALNAASCPTGATVSDLVGYGTTADCFEGLGRAPAPSATVADFRKADGCTDTNDNIADFLVSAPTPRNTSAPANDCTAGPPVPKLTINDVSANEGNSGTTTFTFTVTLSSPAPAGGVSFDIATADGSATDGNPAGEDTDYVARSFTSQTIVAGNLAYTFEVTVNGDLKVESNETFFVNLSNVSGATVADGQGLGTIQNDDVEPVPALSINDVSLNEGNAGPTTFTFTVHSSLPAPAGGITFDIATQDGSATTANNDYLARALAAQTIPAGEQTYTFEVTVNGDLLVEPNETFFVNLTNVFGATVSDGQGLGTIQNDDTANLVISQVYGGGGNSGALFSNDFVEIFNRGTTTINFAITPYSVQYAGATANFGSNKIDLTSGTIAPGKYYLVLLSSGGANGAALPAADAVGGINLAATAGKVALVVGTTALNAASCPTDATVSDLVGYGTTADCFEGLGRAPAPSATVADFRKADGCTDTNDNTADFLVSAPTPRNSTAPFNDCSAAPPPLPNMTINDVTVLEGNSGTTKATFTVTLSTPAPTAGVSFDIATQDGSATASSGDYVSKTLAAQLIPAGQQSYAFSVAVNGDSTLEPDETFLVNVSNASGATVTDSQGVGTIQNDDQPELSINDVLLTEGNSGTKAFIFTVSLSAPAVTPVTFDISTADGTAQDDVPPTEDNDYVANSLTAQTIAAGNQTYTFAVTVNSDLKIEQTETFFVNVTNVLGATVVKAQGQGTIVNDDVARLTIDDVSLNEGNSGTTIFTFTVKSSLPAPAGGITFDIATADVTAQDHNRVSEDNDYVGRSLTGQNIPAGQQTYVFNVTVNGDTAVESDETFFVNITNAANVVDGQGVGTIKNDDAVSRVEVSPGSATLNRGNMQQFTATAFDGGNQPIAGGSFTWGSSNTAAATINSSGLATGVGIGTTTITATTSNGMGGTVSATATLTVHVPLVINEALPQVPLDNSGTPAIEGDSNRDGVRNSDDDEFVEILNNSNAPVDISGVIISDATSNRFTFPASTILAAGRAAVIFGGGTPPASDPAFGGALILTASSLGLGDSGDIITVKLPVAGSDVIVDSLAYGTGNPVPAPGAQSLTRSPDAAIGSAGGGYVTHTTATNAAGRVLSPGTRADGTPFGSPPITLIEVLPAAATVNIGASQLFTGHAYSNGTEVLNVAFIWDSSDTSKATLAPATGRTTMATAIAAGGPTIRARAGGQQGNATLTVDPPTPSLSINDVSTNEGNAGPTTFTFTVSLSGSAPSGGVSFDIATADGSAQDGIPGGEDNDYVQRSLMSQTIPAGNTSYTFNVTVNGDLAIESNETFFVNVTNIAGATIGDAQGLGTIQNDDSPTLTINDVSANETNSGTTTFTFTVTSSSPAPAGGITFDIVTADGTAQDHTPATEDNDYLSRNLTAQTITAGNTTYTFAVTVNGDTVVEPNEAFFVNITNVSGATLADGQGLGTIQNDDTAVLVISQVYAGGGNTGAQFTNDFVEIFNHGTTTVNFATTPYSVQYAGATSSFGSSKVDLTSGTIGPGKYFLVQLSGGANGAPLPTPDATGGIAMAATAGKVALVAGTTPLTGSGCPLAPTVADFVGYGTTADCFEGSGRASAPSNTTADFRKAGGCTDTNDNANNFFVGTPFPRNTSSPANNCAGGAPPNLTINDVTVTEGNGGTTNATFTVSLSAPAPSTDITFDIATQNNTATTANSDYVAKTLTGQIIPAGEQTYTFTVVVNGDVAIENDETFLVNVTNVSGATLLDGQGVGKIQNDDFPTLSINDVSLTEGNVGTKLFTFTVSLSAVAPTGGVTFDIATADGTAQDGNPVGEDNDYVARSLTAQTIPAGSQTYTFSVTVNGDVVIENDETFLVNVTNVSGATVTDGQGLATIQNDDNPALSIDDVTVTEGDSGTKTAIFTVTLSPSSNQIVTVNYATANGTAIAPGDYQTTSGMLTFNPGETTKPINVLVNGDTANEAICETFFVNLSVPTGGATISDPQGQGSITDNDGTKLEISQIYGGGGNASATFTNDFIEIFNRGITAVSLNGMSVQYAAATSTTGNYSVTLLPNVMLQPGQYFLIQEASGGAVGSPLTPDATGTIVMAAGAGKIALVNGTSALVAAGCPSGANIIDFVGYGTTANCREGASTADNVPGPSNNTTSAQRKLTGCQDVGNNQQDFVTAAVSPRNTGTALSSCSCSTSFSSMFMFPGLDSWKDALAFLNEGAPVPPRERSGYAELSH